MNSLLNVLCTLTMLLYDYDGCRTKNYYKGKKFIERKKLSRLSGNFYSVLILFSWCEENNNSAIICTSI